MVMLGAAAWMQAWRALWVLRGMVWALQWDRIGFRVQGSGFRVSGSGWFGA